MLELDQWDTVLSRITGTLVRGTERISSAALLDLLEVGPDPVTRQKVAKQVARAPLARSRTDREWIHKGNDIRNFGAQCEVLHPSKVDLDGIII